MNGKAFVDTNILVYAHDRSAGAKHARAAELVEKLWKGNSGVVSTQVLQELCVSVRRKFARPFSVAETRELIADFLTWEIVINTPASVLAALEIESRYKISFWDALILQAAESSGAEILYSEDLAESQTYASVRVVNPLTSN